MTTYIIRRLIQAIFILFGLTIVFFVILHLTPGGPCAALGAGGAAGAAKIQACIRRLGLDQPLTTQYINWLSNYLQGNFGISYTTGQPVASVILQKLPPTILLIGVSYFFQQLIALPLGMFSALRQYSFFDQLFTLLSYVGLSLPTFWLGIMLIYLFAVHFAVLPVARVENPVLPLFWTHEWFVMLGHHPGLILGDLIRHLILPAFTLMVIGVATDSRFMRASMLEVLSQDYIRTAKAKGLPRRVVIFKHAFRNAVLPIITNIALYLPALIGGAVITETVFAWGGLGYTFFNSAVNQDYPFVQSFLMISAFAVLLANLLADLTYAWVDPRIRYD
jgi:peptide/nickel transport system permease protein